MSKLIKQESASKERGISLVESLLVLGIAASFIAGGIALYGQATATNQAREGINEIYAMIASIKPAYSNRGSYSGLTGDGASYGVGESPWGGDYEIASYHGTTDASDANQLFGIFMDDVPGIACNQIFNTMNPDPDFYVVIDTDATTTAPGANAVVAGVTFPVNTTGNPAKPAAGTTWGESCAAEGNQVLVLGKN